MISMMLTAVTAAAMMAQLLLLQPERRLREQTVLSVPQNIRR